MRVAYVWRSIATCVSARWFSFTGDNGPRAQATACFGEVVTH